MCYERHIAPIDRRRYLRSHMLLLELWSRRGDQREEGSELLGLVANRPLPPFVRSKVTLVVVAAWPDELPLLPP